MLTAYTIHPPSPHGSPGFLYPITFKSLFFSAGEPHVEVAGGTLESPDVAIDARLSEPHELMRLICLTDALRHAGAKRISLFCPYFPGGRQDRVDPGTGFAFTLKVFARIINAQQYERVVIVDPHSDVTTALIERGEVIPPGRVIDLFLRLPGPPRITNWIAPDAGAAKRVANLRREVRGPERPVVQASKHRDPVTGTLSRFELPPLEAGCTYLVVDDICDGGGTFLGLAAKAGGSPGKRPFGLGLYVTHGIFSKGVRALLDAYDFVWTTDSIPTREDHPRLDVLNLWMHFSEELFLAKPKT